MRVAVRDLGTGRGAFRPEVVAYLIKEPRAIRPKDLLDPDRQTLEQMVDAEVLGALEMGLLAGRGDAQAVAALVERGLGRALRIMAPVIELSDLRQVNFRVDYASRALAVSKTVGLGRMVLGENAGLGRAVAGEIALLSAALEASPSVLERFLASPWVLRNLAVTLERLTPLNLDWELRLCPPKGTLVHGFRLGLGLSLGTRNA